MPKITHLVGKFILCDTTINGVNKIYIDGHAICRPTSQKISYAFGVG